MDATSPAAFTLTLGSTKLSKMDIDPERLVMPDFSKQAVSHSSESDSIITVKNAESVYVVLQHSKASGNSALLPLSNVAGVFGTHKDAQDCLHALKEKYQPLVKSQCLAPSARLQFWNTSSGDDTAESGYQYTSEFGEEHFVWIEEHQMRKQRHGSGGGESPQ